MMKVLLNHEKNKMNLSIKLALCSVLMVTGFTSKAKLHLLESVEDGDLPLLNEQLNNQHGIIPIFKSDADIKRTCLDGEEDIWDWCESIGPFQVLPPVTPYNPLDPRIGLAVIDYQLVYFPKDYLSISNGFSPVVDFDTGTGYLMGCPNESISQPYKNTANKFLMGCWNEGFAFLNDGEKSGYLKLHGYITASDAMTLLQYSDPVALDEMSKRSVVFESTKSQQQSPKDEIRNQRIVSKIMDRYELTDFVYVLLDGVLVEMNVGTLINGINSHVYIVIHVGILDSDLVSNPFGPVYTPTFGEDDEGDD